MWLESLKYPTARNLVVAPAGHTRNNLCVCLRVQFGVAALVVAKLSILMSQTNGEGVNKNMSPARVFGECTFR